MPIYEYICKGCENEFEELVFKQDEKIDCPECGSAKVERAMSVFSFSSSGSFHSSHGSGCEDCDSGNCGNCGCGGH